MPLRTGGADKTVLANNVEAKLRINAEKRDEQMRGRFLHSSAYCLATYRHETCAPEKTRTV